MVKMIFLAAFILIAADAPAQESGPADSLRRVLQQQPARDSVRIKTLLNLADAVIFNDPVGAMRYTEEAMEISRASGWTKGVALSFRQKGNVYYVFSDNINAMDCYQQALTAGASLHNKQLDLSLYNNLANIYSDLKQYDKALGYYRQFLSDARELHLGKEEIIALVNMGTVYTEMSRFDAALDSYREALAIGKRENKVSYIPITLNNMGITFRKKGDTDSAIAAFRECIAFARKWGNDEAQSASLEESGKIYLAANKTGKAVEYALASLRLGEKIGSTERQADAWETLSRAYEKQGRPAEALKAYRQHILYRDSVLNDEKKAVLTRKEMQFDFERKETVLKAEHDRKEALAQSEIRRQSLIKNMSIAGALLVLLAAVAILIFYKRRRDAEARRREADFKAMVSDTEMKVLRLQMNPHFIFNALNSIADYISRHETEKACYFLTKFAGMMRLVLESSGHSEIALADDLKVLELYMQLESLRLKNKFSYDITVDDSIDKEAALVPPLILQPFVENSIWHGLSPKQGAGRISIHIKRENDMINCIVEDNGVGRKKTDGIGPGGSGRRSWGLKITRDRIDIINKIKKTNAGVELFDLAEGTRVEVKLPLELNN